MTQFEDNASPRPATPEQVLLEKVSDNDLLLEARRRGLLVRVTANTIAPGRVVAQGYPMEEQVRKTYQVLGDELAKYHSMGLHPMGCKWSEGFFDPMGRSFLGAPKDRQLELVFNYVKEKS